MARYEAGETLASIARTYDCSPPAISYVVSRSRARQPSPQTPPQAPSATAAQLIKTASGEPPVSGNGQSPTPAAPRPNGETSDRRDAMSSREGNANGDHRRTLHLSLGNSSPGNGGTHPTEHHPAERHNFPGEGDHAQPQAAGERVAASASPALHDSRAAPDRDRDGRPATGLSEPRPGAYNTPTQRPDPDLAHRKDGGGAYIDKDLRARVDGDIAAFLAAFDAALVQDTQESRSALREATDRLLRAGARTRIELERLEARMPLPPRDNIGRAEAAWRHR